MSQTPGISSLNYKSSWTVESSCAYSIAIEATRL